jgi:PAS domain S-box-containing protein
MENVILNDTIDSFPGESIIKGMPQIAYIFTREGRLRVWNKNAEDITGYTPDEMYNKLMTDFADEPDRERLTKALSSVFVKNKQQTVSYNLITKAGKLLPHIGSGSPVNINGKAYFVGMAISISELKDTENKLKSLITELSRLKKQLKNETVYLQEEIKSNHDFDEIIGNSPSLKHALFRLDQVAPLDTTVLLEGETGTGKELFARAIHHKSSRNNLALIKVNCAALPQGLIESELFGHEKGAFTDARQRRIGRFELANNGTIFLDEIAELPLELQSKLLRVLQEGEFERLGGTSSIKVNVRVIAATNKTLQDQVRKKLFREDLFYRLHVYPITIPSLKDRKDDIPLLAHHFLHKFNLKYGKQIVKFPAKALQQMQDYPWPGNIRELENVIERSAIISRKNRLIIEQLQKPDLTDDAGFPTLAEHEITYISKVLEKKLWRIDGPDGAAKVLGLHPETLRSRMRKWGIKRPDTHSPI